MPVRNKRMFSHAIVRSDAFLSMPVSSRELYFQLGMDIDDRGYIANAQSVMRLSGATQNDLDILLAKKFLLKRKEGLYLQKHFGINNWIRQDRFQETEYIEDLGTLFIEKNGAYTENPKKGISVLNNGLGIPDGNQVTPQISISQTNLNQSNTEEVIGCKGSEKPLLSPNDQRISYVVECMKRKQAVEISEADIELGREIVKRKTRTATEELFVGYIEYFLEQEKAVKIAQVKWVDDDKEDE